MYASVFFTLLVNFQGLFYFERSLWMSTRLEQIQAAAKAAAASGQKLFSTPVNAPQVTTTPTPQASTPVSSPVKTAQPVTAPKVATTTAPASNNNAAIQTEIQRKASLGIPLTNPNNAANAAAYNYASAPKMNATSFSPTPQVGVAASIPTMNAPKTVTQQPTPTTQYVANGGQTLNDILYLKRQYEGGKTGAAQYATASYNKLDPQTAAMVKGMNAAQLEAYIMGNKGQGTAQTVEQEPAQETIPVKDYRALAQAQYDQELAALLAGAQSQETELNRRYDYANDVTQDNRTLQDASFYRNNAPTAWDGSTGYQAAQQDRNRNIEDHYTQEALTDATAAAYSQANVFRNNAGNYLTTKATELENADKQYNLQAAGLTGYLNGQQTMQGAANAASTAGQLISNQGQLLSNAGQAIANKIAQIDLSNYPETSKLQIQQLQQQVASGKISNDAAAYQLTQLTDPNSTSNQAAALDLQMKQIDVSNYSEQQKLQLEQLRKTVAEIGKVPYQSDADARLDQLKVLTAEAELEKLQETAGAQAGKTFEDLQSNIEKVVQRDKKGAITNPQTIEDYILNSDMSPYEMYRAYGVYGLKWGGEVPSKGE